MLIQRRACMTLTLMICSALIASVSLPGVAQNLPAKAANLNFEGGLGAYGLPTGWGGGGEGYALELETKGVHGGNGCGRLRFTGDQVEGFGTFTQGVSAQAYPRKRIRYSGWLKSQGITNGWAGMWMRVDGAGGAVLAFDNMQDRPVKGTTTWKQYSITLDVPEEATQIVFGFLLAGNGTLWGDDFTLEGIGPARSSAAPKPASHPANVPLTEQERKVVDELHKVAIPFQTLQAGNPLDDLEPLKKIVGDARIVALGEASHGTAEFFKMKHRILEFLVKRMGFTVFAIEANWPESQAADDYIKTNKGDPASALRAMYFWTWQTEEVRDMLNWMRDYNQAPGQHPILSFTSFDMQMPAVAIKRVKDYGRKLGAEPGAALAGFYEHAETAAPSRPYTTQMPQSERIKARERAAEAIKWLQARRDALIAVSSPAEYRDALHCAVIVKQALSMAVPDPKEGSLYDVRDRSMAQNVKWLAEEAFPGQKIVLWAHNGHVSTDNYGGPGKPMGEYLREMFGSRMVVLGFASDHGQIRAMRMQNGKLVSGPIPLPLPPAKSGSVEALFREVGLPRFIVGFHDLDTAGELSHWLSRPHTHRMPGAAYDPESDDEYANVILPRIYDGIIFISESSAAKALPLVSGGN